MRVVRATTTTASRVLDMCTCGIDQSLLGGEHVGLARLTQLVYLVRYLVPYLNSNHTRRGCTTQVYPFPLPDCRYAFPPCED